MSKPLIKPKGDGSGRHVCSEGGVSREGDTPRQAYDFWLIAAIQAAQAQAAEAKAQEQALLKPLVATRRPRRQVKGPVTVTTAAAPAPAGKPVPSSSKPTSYQGPVTVVRGTAAAPRPLMLSAGMRQAAARAAASQPTLATLASRAERDAA